MKAAGFMLNQLGAAKHWGEYAYKASAGIWEIEKERFLD